MAQVQLLRGAKNDDAVLRLSEAVKFLKDLFEFRGFGVCGQAVGFDAEDLGLVLLVEDEGDKWEDADVDAL